MKDNLQQELNNIIETKSRATRLDAMLQGYRLCARTEGKSEQTITIATTSITSLKRFLESRKYSTDVIDIGTCEMREYILYLQQVRAFEHHPMTGPQTKGLSGYTVNTYMRSIRAVWSWMVREEIITSSPFSKVKIPKAPKKVIAVAANVSRIYFIAVMTGVPT